MNWPRQAGTENGEVVGGWGGGGRQVNDGGDDLQFNGGHHRERQRQHPWRADQYGPSDGRFQGSLQHQMQQPSLESTEATCLASLQDSIRTAAQTNEIGRATAVQLDAQEGQIRRIGEDVDQISTNLETSEYLLDGMKSWWGTLKQLVLPPPNTTGSSTKSNARTANCDSAAAPNRGAGLTSSTSSDAGPATVKAANTGGQWGEGFLNFFGSGGGSSSDPAREDTTRQSREEQRLVEARADDSFRHRERTFDAKLNANLDELSGMLEEMHSQAVLVGESIQRQNCSLETIHRKVEDNSDRVAKQQKDINKLMGR